MATENSWAILLIDDEPDILDVTALALDDAGYTVKTAGNGEDGLEAFRNFSPQIVITDIRMPGINGLEVLETIKKQSADTQVIVATAFAEMKLAVRALQLDASDFITKPIHNDALMVALERAKHRYTIRKQLKDYTLFLEQGWEKTSKELIETFSYQKKLIQSSMDGIIGCDETGKIITFNRCMERMLSTKAHLVAGNCNLEQFFTPRDWQQFSMDLKSDRFGGKNKLMLYETSLLDGSGKHVPVQMSCAAIMDNRIESGLVCFFKDLRELRRLEKEMSDQAKILHQDKMMSLGRLAASVAHEINNPLSGILNYVRLMIRTLSQDQISKEQKNRFRNHLCLVEKETDRCSKIVSSLLTFSRKTPLTFKPVSIEDIINHCTVLSRHKLELGNINLTCRIERPLPPVTGDFNQLQQCLINLIFNAVDAMPDGGDLHITAGHDLKRKQISIKVEDTGHGIKEKDQKHLFEPFFTTKKEGFGIGLGLSTTYGIVERHGGTLGVENNPVKGTCFTISLPCKTAEAINHDTRKKDKAQ